MVDPITAEVIRNHFECTAAEIIQSMVRSSSSPLFNESHDCSAGVFYYNGGIAQLVSRANAVPVHIYAAQTSVQACLDFFHGDLSQGDIIIVSDSYYGGTHIADYTVVKPVFYEGQPVFLPSVRGHMLDSGGPYPSAMGTHVREIWQEGCRFAPMKLCEKGELRREVWDFLMASNRLPEMSKTDLHAMFGACNLGEERIRALCDKYGLETLCRSVEWIFDYSERKFREEIRRWPKGRFKAQKTLDSDFVGNRDLKVAVEITVNEDSLEVDFAGTSEQTEGVVNSVAPNTASYTFGVFTALCKDIPVNAGLFRPITLKLPPGSVVNPNPPAATVAATIAIGCDIGDAVMKACEGFAPDSVASASVDFVIYFVFGTDTRNDMYFVHYDYNINPTASGATKGVDGWGAYSALFSAFTMPSMEVTEVQYPCLYRQCEFEIDSAAPGQWRGSPGHNFLREPRGAKGGVLNEIWIQGLRHTLHGYNGGRPACGNYAILRPGQENELLCTETNPQVPSENGDACYFMKGGGGGWGDPLDRDPATVVADVLDEYISVEGAAHDYGVVMDKLTLSIDTTGTEKLRASLRKSRASDPAWLALGRKKVLRRVGMLDESDKRVAENIS